MYASGNTVLITGGTAGIGLALARRFVATSNQVIVTGRDPVKLQSVTAELPNVITVQADMTHLQALYEVADVASAANIVINNAAVQYNYAFTDATISIDVIEHEVRTNVIGPLQLIKLMVPGLLMHKQAAIINISSGLGFVPKQSAAAHCGSKAALHLSTKSLRW